MGYAMKKVVDFVKPDSTDSFDKLAKIQRSSYLKSKGIKPNSAVQLDLFEIIGRDDLRHIPNDYARSSLFTARNKREPRKSLMHEKLFHYNECVTIQYSGQELRAEDDELVWLQILNYGKSVVLGEPFCFSIKDLVRDVGWSKNGRYYDKARECITRLKTNEVRALNSKAYGVSGGISLIHNYVTINDGEGKPVDYRVWIASNLIVMFAGNTFTSHTWEVYRGLSPVTRRLADYIESHKLPYPLDIERFRQMCGSNTTELSSWKQTVKKACIELQTAGIASYAVVQEDLITCFRDR